METCRSRGGRFARRCSRGCSAPIPSTKLDSRRAAAKRRRMTDTTASLTPKPWISGIAPYVPGKSAGADGRQLIKLSANEKHLGTGEKTRAASRAAQATEYGGETCGERG